MGHGEAGPQFEAGENAAFDQLPHLLRSAIEHPRRPLDCPAWPWQLHRTASQETGRPKPRLTAKAAPWAFKKAPARPKARTVLSGGERSVARFVAFAAPHRSRTFGARCGTQRRVFQQATG